MVCEKRKIFVQIPENHPSGGIKVANQLVNLFREHNYESYIVLPNKAYQAEWLISPAPAINISKMTELCHSDDIVIDNWLDKNIIAQTMKLPAKTKVFYSQGCTYYKSKTLIGDDFLKNDFGYTHFWTVSNNSQEYLMNKYLRIKKWYLVHPYLNFEEADKAVNTVKRDNKILTFSRKGKEYIHITNFLFKDKIDFDIVDEFTEEEAYRLYASHKFFLSTCAGVGHQRLRNIIRLFRRGNTKCKYSVIVPKGQREGFPLPPAEAAMCGAIVVGFAMGGGLEWMSPDNCFLAKDRSYLSLFKKLNEALISSDKELEHIRKNAFKAVRKFTKENTWEEIKLFLNKI